MKQVYITKDEFLQNIVKMCPNSLVSNIHGEMYFMSRRAFNIWINTEQCPVFVVEKENLKNTKWLAIPLTV